MKKDAMKTLLYLLIGVTWPSGDMFDGGHHSGSDGCRCERVGV